MRKLQQGILSAFALAALLPAQTVSTEILGLVTDNSGAVLPNATVRARRIATGDVRTTKSNDTGNYVFPLLEIGDYEVTCLATGFRTEVRTGIELQLQQKLRIDFRMQVGEQVERIEVSAAASLLRTEDATLGSVIEHKRIIELPLNGRNFGQLATLMPGVVFGTSRMGIDGQQTIGQRAMPGQIVGLSANGQRDTNQNITLDGVVAVDGFKSAMLFVPSVEAVEEFRVQSAVYSAEYGMNSGVQANVAIRSGGNQIHGALFEFLRNDILDARGFFLPVTSPKNELRRNQYGGLASGPIRKDKTFWLFNYEGRREVRATPSRLSLPTLAMRSGDFSEILLPRNRWYPSDASPGVNRAIRMPGSNAPFPGNIIPASLLDKGAVNLLTFKPTSPFPQGGIYPLPNNDDAARAAGSTLNYAGTSNQILNSDQYLTRIDHRFGDKDRIFGRYVIVSASWDNNPVTRLDRQITSYRAQNLGIGYTRIISPTMLNEVRFGLNRVVADSIALTTNQGFKLSDLGIDMRVAGDNNRTLTDYEQGIPNISISNFSSTGSAGITNNLNSVYEDSDSLSINRGKHNFKFGGQYRNGPVDNIGANNPRGVLQFTSDITGIPDAFAAFMLGFPLSANSSEGSPLSNLRQNKFGFYAIDDFKASSKLTINLGVRWDLYGVVNDVGGRIRNLSFSPPEAQVIGGVTVPQLVPNPFVTKALYDINKKQIMPRLGIAYRFSESMVLRTGAGLFYSPQQTNNFNILGLNPPLSGSVVFQNDRTRPTATIENPLAGTQAAAGPAALVMTGNLQADNNNRSLYLNNDIWQWSVELEKSFAKDFASGVAYVGSQASNLDMSVSNWNNPDPGLGAVQARRPLQSYTDSRNPSVVLPLGTLRRLETWTSASFNALQGRLEKRLSHGLTFNASFNYQRAMSIGYSVNESPLYGQNLAQDPRNRLGDRGRSAIDQRFRYVFSHVWEFPWLRTAKGVTGAVLGGWAINGIIQLQSGLPVTIGQTGDSQNTGAASSPRPNVVPGQHVDRVFEGRTLDQWFNTSAFVRSKCDGCPGDGIYVGPKGYGNAGVALLDAPAQKTWDFALFKEFKIREGHRLQARFESFNFMNTPQFAGPSRNLGAADFGRISSTIINNREMQFGLKYLF